MVTKNELALGKQVLGAEIVENLKVPHAAHLWFVQYMVKLKNLEDERIVKIVWHVKAKSLVDGQNLSQEVGGYFAVSSPQSNIGMQKVGSRNRK